MPPACALLGMTAPASSEKKPIGFMDLPAEIRCMVYKLLAGRKVKVRIPGVEFPPTIIDSDTVIKDCHYPAMARVNKQVNDEYMTLVMPRIRLHTNWKVVEYPSRVKAEASVLPFLPEEVFARLEYLNLMIWMGDTIRASSKGVFSDDRECY
jgi:hypothetical protein